MWHAVYLSKKKYKNNSYGLLPLTGNDTMCLVLAILIYPIFFMEFLYIHPSIGMNH